MKLSRKIRSETKLEICQIYDPMQWLKMGLILKKVFLSMSILFILFSVYSVYIISVPGNIHAWAFSLSPLDLHASRNIRFYFSRNIRFYRSHISFIHELLTKVRPCRKKRKMRNYKFFLLSWLC